MNKQPIHSIRALVMSLLVCFTVLAFSPLPVSATPKANGVSLYAEHCAACHGDLANTTKAGAIVSEIRTAISSKIGDMGKLAFLTTDQLTAIADTMESGGDGGMTTTPDPTDGAALYGKYCDACHGVLSNSNRAGASVAKIQNAIKSIDTMKSFSVLTATQVQAISDALSGVGGATPPPTNGSALIDQ